jgi:hypothetical protein
MYHTYRNIKQQEFLAQVNMQRTGVRMELQGLTRCCHDFHCTKEINAVAVFSDDVLQL